MNKAKDALEKLNQIRAKHAGKNLYNYGELKEFVDAQSALLIALCEANTP